MRQRAKGCSAAAGCGACTRTPVCAGAFPAPHVARRVSACGDARRAPFAQVLGHFKSVYFTYKLKSAKEIPQNPWKVQNAALFPRLDAFLERCMDLLDLFKTVTQFEKLERVEVRCGTRVRDGLPRPSPSPLPGPPFPPRSAWHGAAQSAAPPVGSARASPYLTALRRASRAVLLTPRAPSRPPLVHRACPALPAQVGGNKGAHLTLAVAQNFADFAALFSAFKTVGYDVLDVEVTRFDADFYAFRQRIQVRLSARAAPPRHALAAAGSRRRRASRPPAPLARRLLARAFVHLTRRRTDRAPRGPRAARRSSKFD